MGLRSLLFTSLLLVALGVLGSCRDPDAPRPVNDLEPRPTAAPPERDARPTDTRPVATRPLPPGEPDPAETGITDLARLARYVFREMQVAESICPFVNPLHDPLAFAFHVEVADQRMSHVHLAWAGVRAGEELQPLREPPAELTAYVECLAPRLEAARMDPAPADGEYQPEYSYPGHQGAP